MAVIHRYCSIEEQARMVGETALPAAAVGVVGDFFERAQEMVKRGALVLCIDVAHAHSIMMKKALQRLRAAFGNLHIMAGNVATPEGYLALAKWGADSVRANVGSGSICSTTVQTGHGKPGFQTVLDIAKVRADIARESPYNPSPQIILDGGIVKSGDIAKAIAAGADLIMMGSAFAGTDEAPGEVFETSAGKFKKYSGMAARTTQLEWRGYATSDEGVESRVPYKGPVAGVVDSLAASLRSALSYSGARNLEEFRAKAQFIMVSQASAVEASPHILTRSS